jgi:hypothetical protein
MSQNNPASKKVVTNSTSTEPTKKIDDIVVEQAKEDNIHFTQGTLYDRVNPPSKDVTNPTANNPDSEEALKQRIQQERELGLSTNRYQEELAKKIRLESVQGQEYKLPEDLKNDPNCPEYLKTSFKQVTNTTPTTISRVPVTKQADNLKG